MDHLPNPLRNAIVLKKGEKAIDCWRANLNYESRTEAINKAFVGDKTSSPVLKGIIAATNRRILFLHETGTFSKMHSLRESVDLEKITGLTAKEGLMNMLSVNVETQGNPRTLYFAWIVEVDPSTLRKGRKADTQKMRSLLEGLCQARVAELEAERKRERVQYVLDFSFLRAQMEKGGIAVQTVKCPNCNANMNLPASGNALKCEFCGSMVRAEDVFEKMKGLIGGF